VNPLAIHAQNLRTFECLDVELPTGCVVIGGENGAGKSTILNAIDVALFADRGELASLLSLGEDELQLELTFEHAGQEYRVRRLFSAKGRGKTTLDFEEKIVYGNEHGPDVWDPLTRETAAATQAFLEQTLGLSRTTFRASSFLAQGDGAAFTGAQARDRKAILAEILGLSVYDRLLDVARQELRLAEHTVIALQTKIEALQEQAAGDEQIQQDLAQARAALAGAAERQQVAEQELERALQAHTANAAATERLLHARAVQAAATDTQERARVAYAAAVQASIDREQRQRDLDAAAEVAATAPNLEQRLTAVQEVARLAEQRDQLLRDADQREIARGRLVEQSLALHDDARTMRGKADHLEAHIDESADCDRCGQKLGAEAAARAAESYRTDALKLDQQAAEIDTNASADLEAIAGLREQAALIVVPETTEDADHLEQLLAAARAAGERRATLAEQVRSLAELAATQNTLAIALSDANDAAAAAETATTATLEQVSDDDQLQDAVNLARTTLASITSGVTLHREGIVRLEGAEQRVVTAAAELVACAAEVETIAKSVDVLKLAERAFGRDGIPALIVENAAIPQLELEANRILGELGGATADCRVELRTQRLLKTTRVPPGDARHRDRHADR